MNAALWILIGAGAMTLALAPIVFLLLRSADRRARAAEGEARHSQRLAELGAMTGGLAHEIKNPLSTVGLNAQLLIEDLRQAPLKDGEKDRLIERVETLRREVDRLAGILTDFLQFAGRIQLHPEHRNLSGIIEELGDFFHPQCDQSDVILRVRVPEDPILVELDEGLFKQALLNLMINAVQAMAGEDPPGGELLIDMHQRDEAIEITVTDTGPGIAPDMLDEIFHPYVSGRAGGTGLGLSTTRRIIEEHGGRLAVESELARGTVFTISLPLGKGRAS
ncbi:MAG: ATP-binding protein [Phycisphaerales bacterium]|nr:ATP-binding protein [Phycisphaerales bacterium]